MVLHFSKKHTLPVLISVVFALESPSKTPRFVSDFLSENPEYSLLPPSRTSDFRKSVDGKKNGWMFEYVQPTKAFSKDENRAFSGSIAAFSQIEPTYFYLTYYKVNCVERSVYFVPIDENYSRDHSKEILVPDQKKMTKFFCDRDWSKEIAALK